jgi:hypothetical protein
LHAVNYNTSYGIVMIFAAPHVCYSNMSNYADGRTALEIITGETPDISEYLDFEFYDWVLYRGNAGIGEVKLARWLGVSHRVGRFMSYWLFPESGIQISATMVQRMTNDERASDEMKRRIEQYDERLKDVFETQSAEITRGLEDILSSHTIDPYNEDDEFFNDFSRVIDDAQLKHADDLNLDSIEVTFDPYVGMEMALTRGGEGKMKHATVRRRLRDGEGNPIGQTHQIPLMDSRA